MFTEIIIHYKIVWLLDQHFAMSNITFQNFDGERVTLSSRFDGDINYVGESKTGYAVGENAMSGIYSGGKDKDIPSNCADDKHLVVFDKGRFTTEYFAEHKLNCLTYHAFNFQLKRIIQNLTSIYNEQIRNDQVSTRRMNNIDDLEKIVENMK
jgi:hypothetical protein